MQKRMELWAARLPSEGAVFLSYVTDLHRGREFCRYYVIRSGAGVRA
jgi:hypothetical protein